MTSSTASPDPALARFVAELALEVAEARRRAAEVAAARRFVRETRPVRFDRAGRVAWRPDVALRVFTPTDLAYVGRLLGTG